MGKKKFIGGAALSVVLLIVVFFVARFYNTNKLREQLPPLPEMSMATSGLHEQLTSAFETARKEPTSENIGELGKVYYSSYFYDEAARCLELAAKINPTEWQWNYYLGFLKMELGESGEAAGFMQKVITTAPGMHLAVYRLGEIYQQMDSTKLAEEVLLEVASLPERETIVKRSPRLVYFPLQLYANVLLAKIYMSTNRLQEAEKLLLKMRYEYLTFGPVFRQLEMLYAQQGELDKSVYYRERANDLVVNNTPLDTLMDQLTLMSRSVPFVTKQIDVAIYGNDSRWTYELIRSALKNIPNNKYIISKAVNQYTLIGLGKLALPLIDTHLGLFKDSYNELIKTGVNMADAGYQEVAARYLKEALKFTDQTPEQNVTLAGLLYEKAGLRDEAVQLMSDQIGRTPDNITVLADAAFLFFQAGLTSKMNNTIEKLKRLDSSNSKIIIIQGIHAKNAGNHLKAITLFREAFEVETQNKLLIKFLSDLYYQHKLWKEAISFFRKALQSNPNDSNLQMQLGLLLVTCPDQSLQRLDEGKDYSERAYYNSRYSVNDKISAGRTLAIAYFRLGKLKNASFYINETINLAVKNKLDEYYISDLKRLRDSFNAIAE